MTRCAVYGIGNILLGDDGVGPTVARLLADRWTFSPDVVIEDLGTPSLSLPGYLIDHDVVIFIDAVAGDEPGTIRTYTREEIVAVPMGIRVSPHEPTINDALIVLDFAGKAPADVILIGIVPETLEGGVRLSERVAAAVPRAAAMAIEELEKRGLAVYPRNGVPMNSEFRIQNSELREHI